MWLYIPSPFVPALACSTSGSKPDSAILESWREQSLTSSGKPMPRASLLRSWKQGSYIRRLSGLTLQPSTAALGVESWITSLRGSPASPTASPASSRDSAMPAASERATDPSRTPCASSVSLDPPWSGLRTSLPGFEEDSSGQSERNYQEWVTQSLAHSLSLRRMLAHRTSANGFSSWPTARTEDGESCGNHPGAVDSLTGATRNWATPDANESSYSNGVFGQNLREQSANWPTPDAGTRQGFNTSPGPAGARPTMATAASQWMTPDVPNGGRTLSLEAVAAKGATDKGKRQVGLESQSRLWATPKTPTGGANSKREERGAGGPDLQEMANAWPTPAARDSKGTNSLQHMNRTDGRTDGRAGTMPINSPTS